MKPACPPWLHATLLALLVAWLAARILPGAFAERPFGIAPTPSGEPRARDFPSHLRMARSVWDGDWRNAPASSAYTPAAHRRMLDGWAGDEVPALPFAYSPTMVWLMGPFAPLPDRTAYLVWAALSLAAVVWMIRPAADPLALGCVVFLSRIPVWALYQGQTVFLTAAALLWLLRPGRAAARPLLAAVVLWALTAKPPFAVTAAAVLLAAGHARAVLCALALTAASTLALQPLLGPAWAADYVELLKTYNSQDADPLFAWCLEPTYMSNLRAALYAAGVGDALASRASSAAWAVALAALVVCGRRKLLQGPAVAALAVLVLLLFSPHANITDELHLYVAGALAVPLVAGGPAARTLLFAYAFAAAVWLNCLSGAGLWVGAGPWVYPLPAFAAKVVLAALTVWVGRSPAGSRASPPLPADPSPSVSGLLPHCP